MRSALAEIDPDPGLPPGAEGWVAGFQRADQALLAARLLTRRDDYKYLISLQDLPPLLEQLSTEHAVLSSGRIAWARYRTRYYDSPELGCFHDHRRRLPRRFKVRHRDYLDRRLRFFEIKHSTPRGGTQKGRLAQPFADGWPRWGKACRDFLEQELGRSVGPLVPTVDNAFSRLSLLGLHAEERVTIDMNLRFDALGRRGTLPELVVVEIKTATPRHRSPTLNALTRAGLRPGGMSKYCAALALLSEEPTWFPKLRRRIDALSPVEVRSVL